MFNLKGIFCINQPVLGQAFGITHPGRVREHNEDAFCIAKDKGLFMVADGLGGCNAGEVASQTAIDAVMENFANHKMALILGMPAIIRCQMETSVQYAHSRIRQKGQETPEYQGMGTTMVLACLQGATLHLASVGDSRAYIINAAGISRLTRDHTIAAEMVRSGQPGAAEAMNIPLFSSLTQDLGAGFPIDPEYSRHTLSKGDIVLLCSDGLWKMLDDARICRTVLASRDLEAAGKKLVERANNAGGRDNITVVLLQVE